jgi:hypothetical protein
MNRAIDTYVRIAYPDGPPVTVRSMLATQRGWKGKFQDTPTFVKDRLVDPTKFQMRLGNAHYPHMKLTCELSPDGKQFLFKADAHDAHCCPPAGTPEHQEFRKLMEQNQQTVTAIENAWAAEGIPTFKSYLKEDLERRRAKS